MPARRVIVPAKPTRINNMLILFYLPFIIATGMVTVASESMRIPAKQAQRVKKD